MIQSWIETVLGDANPASEGRELVVGCPFCDARRGSPDTKHHMYVSLVKPVAFCFRCGWQGSHISLVMGVSGCKYGEALKLLQDPIPNVKHFDKLVHPAGLLVSGLDMESRPDRFIFTHEPIPGDSLEQKAIWNYLVWRRGIPEAIVCSRMGCVPGTNRAWILVDNHWWQGRMIVNGEPKYISPPWPKGDAMWNSEALRRNGHIYIAEGVFSALAIGSNAVALCGKTATSEQVRRIVMARLSSITIILDSDAFQDAYALAGVLVKQGFNGALKIHKLVDGDPTDGLDGEIVTYDWDSLVRYRMLAAA